jgi:hypothetical protein
MFRHSQTRLSIERLVDFFTIHMNEGINDIFHRWLLKRQPFLSIFHAREYMIHLVPDQPAMLQAMRNTFPWDRFAQVCCQVSSQVRLLIDNYGFSCLFVQDTMPIPVQPGQEPALPTHGKRTKQLKSIQQHSHTGDFYWHPSLCPAPLKGHICGLKSVSGEKGLRPFGTPLRLSA